MTRDDLLLLAVISGVVYWATRSVPESDPIPGIRTYGSIMLDDMHELRIHAMQVCKTNRSDDFDKFCEWYRTISSKYSHDEVRRVLEKIEWHSSPTMRLVDVPEYLMRGSIGRLGDVLVSDEYALFFASLIFLGIFYINCAYVVGYYKFEEVRAARFRQAAEALEDNLPNHHDSASHDPSRDLTQRRLAAEVQPTLQRNTSILNGPGGDLWFRSTSTVSFFDKQLQRRLRKSRNLPKSLRNGSITEEALCDNLPNRHENASHNPSRDLRQQRFATEERVTKKKTRSTLQRNTSLLDGPGGDIWLRSSSTCNFLNKQLQESFNKSRNFPKNPRNFPKNPRNEPIIEEDELCTDED